MRTLSMITLISVFAIMVIGFFDEPGVTGITGHAVKSDANIYEYLTYVKNHPEQFQVVVGKNAKQYEKEYGEKIAEHFEIKYNSESDVRARKNLILFGNPNTNNLLDKLYKKIYTNGDSAVHVSDGNLMLVVSREDQAKSTLYLVQDFKNKKGSLMLSEVGMGAMDIFGTLIIITVAFVAIFILVLEIGRKKVIRKDKQQNNEEVLANYVRQLKSAGRNLADIRNWLISKGYDELLVDKVIKNA